MFMWMQPQPWPYLGLFSHNTTMTHRRTNGQQMHRACQTTAVAHQKEGVCFWGDKVPFHRLYMPRWCIKVGGGGTMVRLARPHKWFSVFLDFKKVGKFATSIDRSKAKCFSFRGGEAPFAPLNPWPGALPLDPAGGSTPDPHYRLSLAMVCPPLSNTFRGLRSNVTWLLN